MDPFTTVNSLYSLAMTLKQWLDDTKEKEIALVTLSNTVSRVCHILNPFRTAANLEPTVVDACMSISVVLTRVQQHLIALKDKRRRSSRVVGFLMPGDILKSLKDDEHELTQELNVMLFALVVIAYFHDRSSSSSSANTDDSSGSLALAISNIELLAFWRKYVGDKVGTHSSSRKEPTNISFKLHFETPPSDEVCQTVMCQLDEYAMGGVSLSNLSSHVGQQSLVQFFQRFNTVGQLRSQSGVQNRLSAIVCSQNLLQPKSRHCLVVIAHC
jgi:hypothetical protein